MLPTLQASGAHRPAAWPEGGQQPPHSAMRHLLPAAASGATRAQSAWRGHMRCCRSAAASPQATAATTCRHARSHPAGHVAPPRHSSPHSNACRAPTLPSSTALPPVRVCAAATARGTLTCAGRSSTASCASRATYRSSGGRHLPARPLPAAPPSPHIPAATPPPHAAAAAAAGAARQRRTLPAHQRSPKQPPAISPAVRAARQFAAE